MVVIEDKSSGKSAPMTPTQKTENPCDCPQWKALATKDLACGRQDAQRRQEGPVIHGESPMTKKCWGITACIAALVLIFALGNVQGFNGFGDKGGGKEDSRREHGGGKPSGPPAPHQPSINTHGPERPSAPPGGGYTKPVMPEQGRAPKIDAVKPQPVQKPTDGYPKPGATSERPHIKPEAVNPPHGSQPPKQQTPAQEQRRIAPPQAGQPPSVHPDQPGQRPHATPGAQGAPVHGIQPQPGQGHRPTPEQVQNFLKLPKPEAGSSKPSLGKIGAGALGVAAGAIALDHFLNKDKPRQHGQEGSAVHYPQKNPHPHDASQIDPERIRETYAHRYRQVFDEPWMMHHTNLKPYYWHSQVWPHQRWNYWWRPATWALLSSWIPWNWGTAVYYDYGNNFYYDDGYVILNGQRLCRGDEYYNQALKIVSNIPAVRDDPDQWMPLGVFALKPAAGEASDMILQMAVNKDGVIEGTYYNATNDTAKPIRGIVDKKTQRAVWTFADDQDHSVILETGLYNLTLDQTKVLVHFGKRRAEEWLLVRLQEPPA
jgi:hypothetical protein